jgi:hypothetical protein
MEWKVPKEWEFTVIDTAGDHVAVAASSATTESPIVTSPFIVWNWKTGIPLVSKSSYRAGEFSRVTFLQIKGEATGYLFLDKDTLLLLQFDPDCSKYFLEIIEIYAQRPYNARFYLPSLRGTRLYTHLFFMERAETIDKDHVVQLIGISASTTANWSISTHPTHDLMFFISSPRLLKLYRTFAILPHQQRRGLLWHEWFANRGRWIVCPARDREGPTVCGTRGILSIRCPKAEFGFTSDVLNAVSSHIRSNTIYHVPDLPSIVTVHPCHGPTSTSWSWTSTLL